MPANARLTLVLLPVAALAAAGVFFLLRQGPEKPAPAVRKPLVPAPDPGDQKAVETSKLMDDLHKAYDNEAKKPVDPVVNKLRSLDGRNVAVLYELQRAVLDRSRPMLMRSRVFKEIIALDDPLARQFVFSVMNDREEDLPLRNQAIRAVGNFKTPEAFDELESLHRSKDGFPDKYVVVHSIGLTGDPRAVPILMDALDERQPVDVRSHAAAGLQRHVGDALVREKLRQVVLKDRDRNVRISAMGALCADPDPTVDEFLRGVTDRVDVPDPVRNAARSWIELREKKRRNP